MVVYSFQFPRGWREIPRLSKAAFSIHTNTFFFPPCHIIGLWCLSIFWNFDFVQRGFVRQLNWFLFRLTLFFINCSGTSMHTKLAFEKLVVVLPEQRNEKSWTSNIFFLIFKERHFTMKLNLKQFFKRVSHTHNAQVKIISVSYLRRDKVPSNFIIAFKNPIWNFPEKLFYSKQLTAC